MGNLHMIFNGAPINSTCHPAAAAAAAAAHNTRSPSAAFLRNNNPPHPAAAAVGPPRTGSVSIAAGLHGRCLPRIRSSENHLHNPSLGLSNSVIFFKNN